jgi:4-amino-4-deoxy-L-arabinose transferase-like glycosyltransferase
MSRLTRYHALAFMAFCLLVAAGLRLPDLTAVPPGVHYDEAAYGLNAGDIGLRGERPIFIPSFTGREVLYLYLAGGMAAALGNTLFALRLTSAFIGLLTIAATYWLGREMLADRRVALLAAALLAVSFWHLLFSRLGFRVISQPLLQALAVAALFRGLRGGRWMWLWLAGLFIGLTAYTYLAARLFPVLLAFALLPLLLDPDTRPVRWRQLLFVALVAFLTALPLLAYFALHPDAFWVRIGQVSPASGEALTLTESLLRSFGMFFLVGDPYLRFNLPGRPLFDFVTGGLLLAGWLIGVARYRRLPYDWQRAAVLLLLLAPLVMILPTALAVNEIVPSNLRAMGLIPFVFYLPPIGLFALLRDVERRWPQFNLNYAAPIAFLLLLWGGNMITQRLYFQEWATQDELLLINDGDLTAAAAYLDETLAAIPPEEQPTVYVAAPHYRHPTLAFLSANYDRVKWLPQSRALVFPAAGPALYLYPANSPAPAWALPYLEADGPPEIVRSDSGQLLFTVYRLEEPPPLPAADTPTNFGGLLALERVDAGLAAPGESLPVTLVATVLAAPPDGDSLATFVHLEDLNGHRWSQVDQDAYPAEQWTPGEVIIQRVDVPVPPGAPPGENGLYQLRVGFFDPAGGDRLPRLDETGSFAGDALLHREVTVLPGPPPDPLPQPPNAIGETPVEGLVLLGYERGADVAETGEPIDLALWWLAEAPLPYMTLNLSLVGDTNGVIRPFGRIQPVYNTYPFSLWQTPAFIIDRQVVRVPDDLPSGDYRFRLELLDGQGQPLYETDLGPLAVEQTARVSTLPPFDHPVGASFGGEIALPGYNLREEGGTHTLELIWQAETQPTADYTVFVHVLRSDGTCCVWQADAMPQGGSYPTSRWVAGEVVVDPYEIVLPEALPAGQYALEVGLYVAETGRRLEVATTDGQVLGDALPLRALSIE